MATQDTDSTATANDGATPRGPAGPGEPPQSNRTQTAARVRTALPGPRSAPLALHDLSTAKQAELARAVTDPQLSADQQLVAQALSAALQTGQLRPKSRPDPTGVQQYKGTVQLADGRSGELLVKVAPRRQSSEGWRV